MGSRKESKTGDELSALVNSILSDPKTSNFLRTAVVGMVSVDPEDTVEDARVFYKVAQLRLRSLQPNASPVATDGEVIKTIGKALECCLKVLQKPSPSAKERQTAISGADHAIALIQSK